MLALKELYVSQNGIQAIRGLENNLELEILDMNYNRIQRIENVSHLQKLTDFWASQNKLSDFNDLEELAKLPKLTLAYLEMNPWPKKNNYRSIVIRSLTSLLRLDSEICRG